MSRVEMMIVVGAVLVIGVLVLGAVQRARVTADGVDCAARLRQIGVAFTHYALDNGGTLPEPYANRTTWERSLSKYVGDDGTFFRCAGDGELYPAVGSSYDWRDTGDPATTLAGRSITDINRPDAVLAFEALPGWHEKQKMNAVRVDGAAEVMDQEQCMADLTRPLRRTTAATTRP